MEFKISSSLIRNVVLSLVLLLVSGREMPLKRANVLFIVDESNSVWEPDFRRELRFVQETVGRFEVGENYTRVALITYSHYAKIRFGFDVYYDVESLVQALDKIRRPEGYRTRLAPALKNFIKLLNMSRAEYCLTLHLQESNFNLTYKKNRRKNGETSKSGDGTFNGNENDRPVNVAVLLGDGDLDDFKEASAVANCLKDHDIYLFGVAVGRYYKGKTLDEISNHPLDQYRINILNSDPPNLMTDALSDCKPGRVWELLIKNRAMSEDCIPFRKKIIFNFVLDIISPKSWRKDMLLRIAEEIYANMMQKIYSSVKKRKDFVKVHIHPRSYGLDSTMKFEKSQKWLLSEEDRLEELREKRIELRKTHKNSTSYNFETKATNHERRKACAVLNPVLSKIIKNNATDKQQLVIYMTDRKTEPCTDENAKNVIKIASDNRNVPAKRYFELFAVALGVNVSESSLSSMLRQYQANPQSRLFVFDSKFKKTTEIMKKFVDLFCTDKVSKKLPKL